MTEEIYIKTSDGERKQLDLGGESGITLNFKSNIFGDLSKITSSYSYTFKLPLTTNNRQVLDFAEDIRHQSSMIRKRLKAEFIQNGIPLFENANLYIDAVEDSYKAVMTWGVVEGFENLKNNDISLRELPSEIDEVVRYGNNELTEASSFNNSETIAYPVRNDTNIYNGYIASSQKITCLPVVSIYSIIERINNYYGMKFNLGSVYNGSDKLDDNGSFKSTDDDYLINRGVIPFTKRDLTQEQLNARTAKLTNIVIIDHSLWGVALTLLDGLPAYDVVTFDLEEPEVGGYFEIGSATYTNTNYKFTFYKNSQSVVEKILLDGRFIFVFSGIGVHYNPSKTEVYYDTTDIVPKLIVNRRYFETNENSNTGEIKWDEAATLEGTHVPEYDLHITNSSGDPLWLWAFEFDFKESNGKKRLEIEGFANTNSTYPCVITVSAEIRNVILAEELKIIPQGRLSDNVMNGYEMDLVSNLPDISCMTFIKSLFYMMGAFPSVNSNNEIVPCYYTDILTNIKNKKILNWSNRLIGGYNDLAAKIDFKISGFEQKNYYLLKNDDIEQTVEEYYEEEDDIYENAFGVISVENETLDTSKTIIQLPFYGPYIKDKTRPSLPTGNDVKNTKYNDDGSSEFCESKPAVGIIRSVPEAVFSVNSSGTVVTSPTGRHILFMDIWNGFKDITENENYNYLQQIVKKPFVITEKMRLNEFDLKELDYTVPIYIDKYNSNFAIVSITRDSKGICKCELLKLP